MKQKINLRLGLIALVALILTTVGVTKVYYDLFRQQVGRDLRLTAHLLGQSGEFTRGNAPKLQDPEVGMRLAYTGAVKDDILDTETLGCHLMELLAREYPQALTERYKIDIPEEIDGWELLQAAGRKRGFLVSRGEVDTERMARVLLDEYRSCKLGTFTLERPEELQ